MRRTHQRLGLVAGLAILTAVASLPACSEAEPGATDVCGQATNRFASCGTSLPLLQEGPCSGTTRIVARCVVDHAHDCDELSTLFGRIDACVADMLDGGDSLLPPATDLPVAGRDGGKVDDTGHDVTPAPPRDAGADARGPTLDGGVDAGPVWTGLNATGTVLQSEEKHFQTPALPIGSYTFAMTGTGDADLYVRETSAPTTSTYDCRPFAADSTESCTITLRAPAVVHVMIRGAAASSTFTLQGSP